MSVDLIVFRQYEYGGIKVVVEINRLEKTVSLVEQQDSGIADWTNKKYVFAERKLEYMNGWLLILKAMEYAITEAKKELEKFKDEDTDKLIKIFVALDKVKDKELLDE